MSCGDNLRNLLRHSLSTTRLSSNVVTVQLMLSSSVVVSPLFDYDITVHCGANFSIQHTIPMGRVLAQDAVIDVAPAANVEACVVSRLVSAAVFAAAASRAQ